MSPGTLTYFGAHYRLCPVEVREVWARALADDDAAARLKQVLGCEVVLISTCNRFDVCALGSLTNEALCAHFSRLAEEFLKSRGEWNKAWEERLAPERLHGCLRFARDREALRLLFRVSASLDSLVIGEPHILGQVKDAYARARKLGLGGPGLTPFFARAFHVAKRVRSETDLGKNGVSIGHAAVEITRRVYENLADHKVLVVGAGEMARIVTQHFLACGAKQVSVANRSRERAVALVEEVAASPAGATASLTVRDLASSLGSLGEYDIAVVATSATGFLVERKTAEKSLRKRGGRPTVVVDISVPRNVSPDLANCDNTFVFDVDDLDKIMEHNRVARRESARRAEVIVENELESFSHERKQRESLKSVGRFHAWVRNVVSYELTRKSRTHVGLPFETADVIAEAIAKRLVASSASLAREPQALPPLDNVGDALEALFRLDDLKPLKANEGSAGGAGSPAKLPEPTADAQVILLRKDTKA